MRPFDGGGFGCFLHPHLLQLFQSFAVKLRNVLQTVNFRSIFQRYRNEQVTELSLTYPLEVRL